MTITLILFASAGALELLVHLLFRWRNPRRLMAILSLFATGLTSGMLIAIRPNVFSGLLFVLSLYRMFNMLRIFQERMHQRYLRNATRRTSLVILIVQLVVTVGWWSWDRWHNDGFTAWAVLGVWQLTIALLLLLSVVRNLRKTVWYTDKTVHYGDSELPTVTVAIPARNETEDLQVCLERIIASDYPKLEIIVLDDCSQITRTPEIIRQFAHDGVRFIQGHEPDDTWLAKNQAYARLAEEASGSYMLFCGVDARFEPQSIRAMVTAMQARGKQMLCILPHRQTSAYGHASLIQAMRYWWELVPPRRSFHRPPVLSSCWMIQTRALKKAGGFAAVSRAVVPEAHFAKSLLASDGYSFLRSTDGLGIASNKPVAEQRETAIRMRYPQLHKRPEHVALLSMAELVFLLLPFIMSVIGFWVAIGPIAHVTAAIASLLLVIVYECLVLSTKVNSWWFGIISQPLAVLSDIVLLHYSMSKYELSTVEWKGRNVCIPVMHVVPHLPYATKKR